MISEDAVRVKMAAGRLPAARGHVLLMEIKRENK